MPAVSIIIPCLNEEKNIQKLLDALLNQTYPIEDMEVIIADGISTDRTVERIEEWKRENPLPVILVTDNAKRIIPAALNTCINLARGEFIVRMDAHSIPQPDYVERCVSALKQNLAENVGGRWDIKPGADTLAGRGIARAASSPFGVGNAKYRYAEKAEYVDTVPYGSYRKETLIRVGGFDEKLPVNEDYDLNTRLRRSGGKIWFDPAIRCVYFARESFRALAKQYWRYGYWKVRMLKKDPKSIRWRQLVPPLFVAALAVLIAGSFFSSLFGGMLLLLSIFYLMALLAIAIRAAKKENDLSLLVGMPIAIVIMHFSWGGGFIWGLLKLLLTKK